MNQITAEMLFPLSAYGELRKHTRAQGYCDPFVPFVGEQYGNGDLPRFVYSGVAAGWDAHQCDAGDDEDVRVRGTRETTEFIAGGMNGSAFWKLFDAALALFDPDDTFSIADRRQRAVWTNLSKTGLAGETSAPDRDLKLRELDASQFRHEVELLRPEFILCPSGVSLAATGDAVFSEWPKADLTPSLSNTSIKRTPDGGWLYWTMHPLYKRIEWTQAVLSDVRMIAERIHSDARDR